MMKPLTPNNQSFSYKSSYLYWLIFWGAVLGLFGGAIFLQEYKDGISVGGLFMMILYFALFYAVVSVWLAFVIQKELRISCTHFDFPYINAFFRQYKAYSFLPAGFKLSFRQLKQIEKIKVDLSSTRYWQRIYGPGFRFVGEHFKIVVHDVWHDGDELYNTISQKIANQGIDDVDESAIIDNEPTDKTYVTARWLKLSYVILMTVHILILVMALLTLIFVEVNWLAILLFAYSSYRLYRIFVETRMLKQSQLRLEGGFLYLADQKLNPSFIRFLCSNSKNNKIDLSDLLRVEYLPRRKDGNALVFYEEIKLIFSKKRRQVRFRNTSENTGELLADLIAIAQKQQQNAA
ncbi:MAG: hypothetical protein HAW67_00690 [Endozoicomonadaceae bacterium]|nr:hypothetical protein [Endozoicomonadaceae bacterium]